jgi:hypothetical protein
MDAEAGHFGNYIGQFKNGLPMSLFTQEDLLLYLYKETTPEQTVAITTALASDWTLMEQLNTLKSSTCFLDEELVAPRFEAVQHVLNYARETMETATA